MTIGDANAGATDTLSITLSGPGSLSGTGLSVSSGTYTLSGTAAAITSELQALSFTPVDGVPNTSVTTTFTLSDTSSAYGVGAYGGPISTLATFTGANGARPWYDLVSDAAGDLFGVTLDGGAAGDGTVFEIVKSTGALISLASFTGANGANPWGVTSDAAGDLFGTTTNGGPGGQGTVFEIAKSTGQLTTLAAFTGANGENPYGTVISDAAGDLFGTTAHGGPGGEGTVFEIAKSTGALTTLATFTGVNGATPAGTLTLDAEGDLFGTTANNGAGGDGTVFEIVKSTGQLTTLANFTGANGGSPERGVTIDAAGDLFGTTYSGGADDEGTVFEIVKSTGALITLATFTGANGAYPLSQLVSDAAGDLFGTTETGGANNDGTVFEIVKSTHALITLASFTDANGQELDGSLTINSAGDLFGTTFFGGVNGNGTVFELPAGSAAPPVIDTTTTVIDSDPVAPTPKLTAGASTGYTAGASAVALDPGLSISDPESSTLTGATISIGAGFHSGDALSVGSPQAGVTSSYNAGTGVLTLSGSATLAAYQAALNSITFASPSAANPSRTIAWSINDGINTSPPASSNVSVFADKSDLSITLQNTSGQLASWQANGVSLSASGLLNPNPGPGWSEMSTGAFFSGDTSDILWQSTNGSVAVWQEQNGVFLSVNVVANPGPAWLVESTGDFNGDGATDVVLQNYNGDVAVWGMNGAGQMNPSQSAEVANPGPDLARQGHWRFQPGRQERHRAAERQWFGGDLGHERRSKGTVRRGRQSRPQLACRRNGRPLRLRQERHRTAE